MYKKVSTDLNFVQREKEVLKFWNENDIFRKSIEERKNGETYTFYTEKIALSKEQIGQGVYVLYSAEKNGTKRSFVRLTQVVTGAENNGYLEIISGINYGEKIATSSTTELYDEAEVVVVKK